MRAERVARVAGGCRGCLLRRRRSRSVACTGLQLLNRSGRVRFMVMVWLEGGQGEVSGACAPPPPHNTPNRPTWTPPPQPTLPEPPPPSPS